MPQVEISEKLAERLQKIIQGDNLKQLAEAALTEWAGWLDGSARPSSMSELETQRIVAIYETILADDLPSTDHIGQVFRLPMGRARYIAQSIAYRNGELMRLRRVVALLKAFETSTWEENHENCTVVIDPSLKITLDTLLRTLLNDGRIGTTVRGELVVQGVQYEFGDIHYTSIVEALREQLQGLLP